MKEGEFCAWHYRTGEPVRVRWAEGGVVSMEPAPVLPPRTDWLAPSLLDLQINGYGGVDFQRDGVTMEELLRAARGLRADGCARWFLTLITDEWERLLARLEHFRRLRAASVELQECILGWHVEGPFLSAEPGYAGAHNPSFMRDPSPERIAELRAVVGSDPVLLTLAPERIGAMATIQEAVTWGWRVSLGHTNASGRQLADAVAAGAAGFTHLGNGCPRQLDRQDNILWRALDTPGLTVGLIVDGIHVSRSLFRILHRVIAADRLYYTTDAMSAAGAPPGRYRLGGLDLDVGEDQVVRQPGSPLFAGSALRPVTGVERASAMLERPWQEVWAHYCEVPARFMGWSAEAMAGRPNGHYWVRVNFDGRIERVEKLPF